MIDYKFMKFIELVGYVNEHGKHIYGTAALLHVLHCPVKSVKPEHMELGKKYVESLLSA